ncbi:MAG: hypothetical protein IPQ19_15460 [Bacteroidetes bacterium]|nr:hypothetical protein [Bacteroidota bacterium]
MLEYVYLTNRIRQSELFDIVGLENSTESHFDNEHHCSASELLQFNSLFAQSVMEAYDFSNFEKDEYLKQTLIGLVLHEVGHTFDLITILLQVYGIPSTKCKTKIEVKL